MADYAAKPTKAKEDAGIIELRKRMLAVFLNRCRKMDQVREDGVWLRFLDPNASWVSCRAISVDALLRSSADV
jgi:sorting nexin-41/42